MRIPQNKKAPPLEKKSFPFYEIPKGFFPPLFLDYLTNSEKLTPFYNRFPSPASLEQQIKEKQQAFPSTTRKTLFEEINRQYKGLSLSKRATQHLNTLTDKNTFTITTGHQLNIFTGPLYIIYKIVSTINLCKKLKQAYPCYNFVPVYWMASEDHDFNEINRFTLYGKTYTWHTPQQGRVGKFDPRDMHKLLDQIPGTITPFREAYLSHQCLSNAVRHYMNELFGEEGLIVLDADSHALKTLLIPVVIDDLFHHTPQVCVKRSDQQLRKRGYSLQTNIRDINFFYIEQDIRGRIEREKDAFFVQGTGIAFEAHSLREIVRCHPERFSPNVSLRPLYQEKILPNIAYIGGPSEIAYWLQLKSLFDHYRTPFPVLVPRNFAFVVDAPTARTWKKTTLSSKDLFKTTTQLHTQWTHKHTQHHLALEKEKKDLSTMLQQIEQKATDIDSTLQGMVKAEAQKVQKTLNKIEHRMLRAEKRKHSNALQHIDRVKKTLFPGGKMQERVENFLTFYQTDPVFIHKLLHTFDPLDFRFQLLSYPVA